MEAVERLILKRLIEFDTESEERYFQCLTMLYMIKYFGDGGDVYRCEDRYVMDMSATEGDELYYVTASLRDKMPVKDKQMLFTPMRWLARTLGSIREGADGPYFDDSYESRMEWVAMQVQYAYGWGFDDPLHRAEDGVIWIYLFEQAFDLKDEHWLNLTYGLRMLRRRYEMKFVATDGGLVMRGKAGGAMRYRKLMELTGRGEWMKEKVAAIRRQMYEAYGAGEAARIKEALAGAGRSAASAVRASDEDDGAAGRSAEGVVVAVEGGGQRSEVGGDD